MGGEGGPKFRVTETTRYGDHLEKINPELPEVLPVRDQLDSFPDQYDLSPEQRSGLLDALRQAGKAGAFIGALAAGGSQIGKVLEQDTEPVDPNTYTVTNPAPAPGYRYAMQAKAGVVDLTNSASLDGIDPLVAADLIGDFDAEPLSEFEKEVLQKKLELDPVDVERTYNLAQQPAEGTGNLSRMEYVQQAFLFDDETAKERGWSIIPPVAWQEFSRLAPGWVGQESRFKESATSSSDARGPYQYKKNAWKDSGRDGEVSRRYDEQAVATIDLIVKNYQYLQHYAADQLAMIERLFDSEESYWADFIVPLLLTAHNGGGPAVGKELKRVFEDVSVEHINPGKDLVWDFITQADLRDEVKGYARQVKAVRLALALEQARRQA